MEGSLTRWNRRNRYRLIKRIFYAFRAQISPSLRSTFKTVVKPIEQRTFPLGRVHLPTGSRLVSDLLLLPSLSLLSSRPGFDFISHSFSPFVSTVSLTVRAGVGFSRGPYVRRTFRYPPPWNHGNPFIRILRKIENSGQKQMDESWKAGIQRGGELFDRREKRGTPAAPGCPKIFRVFLSVSFPNSFK